MEKKTQTKQEIVVVQRDWVFVGEPTIDEAGGLLVLNNAKNIRIWGTKNGLGELALRGVQKNTILDAYGVVKIPMNAILARIECKVEL